MQETRNRQISSEQSQTRSYDLEARTTQFGRDVIRLCQRLSRNVINNSLIDQVVRSAGSIGANYREANDALGKKDFLLRVKIARKEAKETLHWLELLTEANSNEQESIANLWQEATELRNILSAILIKSQAND